MAWDSSATMQLTSSYQGMYSQQMGFSQQLSGYGQYQSNQQRAEGMMMSGMRGAGHLGNAAIMGGGIVAGMGATAAFGAVAGTGIGIPIAAAGMAMTHVGSQMYSGAEQQATLNQQLRGSFGFRNSQGGHGFSGGDMASIGGSIREMSHQVGAGGEMTSFRELGNIASKMGQMGFAQGVKDVATFSKKFKEMTDALKTMAKDLGTTMEGAMEFAQAAKGSGVFGMSNAAKFGSIARSTAVSGGLAMSEVTAMAGIGSQISRSVGGLGKSGAMAGMKTIGQIGTATQMGILSEEDIYNATGLTGAEGRQAYAASSLQKTASFLSSGRGRRTLASMAGKDGHLDMNAVDQLMSGGMGVGETMSSAQSHLGQVGRANFIRNEGRLRGEAMEKIGGFLPGIQMAQWAKSKGVDINNMDDRSMLFAQRQLGMGRDEVDQAIKMAQEMPRIVAQQNSDASSDKFFQKRAQQRKTQGIEGIKNRFHQAEEQINGAMEKMGQDIFNEGSSKIESFLNKLAGIYVQSQMQGLDEVSRDIRRGGHAGAEAQRKYMNKGAGAIDMKGVQKLGMPSDGKSLYESMKSGSEAGNLVDAFGKGEGGEFLLRGQNSMAKLKDAGMRIDVGGLKGEKRDEEIGRLLTQNQAQTEASRTFDAAFGKLGRDNSDAMKKAYSMGPMEGLKNDARMDAFAEKVLPTLSKEAQERYKKASPIERAQMIGNLEVHAGITGPQALGNNMGAADEVGEKMRKGFSSEDEEAKYLGERLGAGKEKMSVGERAGAGFIKGMLGGALTDWAIGDSIDNLVAGKKGSDSKNARERGRVAMSKEYMSATSDLFGLKGDDRKKALSKLEGEMANMEGGTKKTMFQDLVKLSDYDNLQGEERKKAAAAMGITQEEADKRVGTIKSVHDYNATKNTEEIIKKEKQYHSDVMGRLKDKGLVGADGQIRKLDAKEAKALGEGGQAFLQGVANLEKEGSLKGPVSYDDKRTELANMSVSQRRAIAAQLGGHELGADAAGMNTIDQRLTKGGRLGGSGSVAYALGMDAKQAKALKGVDLSTQEGIQRMAGELGLGNSETAKEKLKDAAYGLKHGNKGMAVAALDDVKKEADGVKREKEKAEKQASADNDPSYQMLKKMQDHLDKIANASKNTEINTKGTESLLNAQAQRDANK